MIKIHKKLPSHNMVATALSNSKMLFLSLNYMASDDYKALKKFHLT